MFIESIVLQYWQPALFSFLVTVFVLLLALRGFPRLGLMDRPHLYGLKRAAIPYYGGLVIWFSFMLSVWIFVPLSEQLIGLLIAGTMIFLLGFLDDLKGLSPFLRLFVQFLACCFLVYSGVGILSINLPFFGVLEFSEPIWNGVMVLSAAFTVFWVMTILNTMNFVDGVSGLNSGITFVAGMTIFALSVHPGLHSDPQSQIAVATISLILAMVALAFLLFDFPKPRILMGDTGSTFFGFMLATLAIFSGGKVATAFLVLGIPILDMLWVVLRRILSGKRPWQGDLKHLHHRLMDAGLSQRQVVTSYLFLTAFFGSTAVFLVSGQQKFFVILALLLLMLALAAALIFLPKK